MSWKILKKKKDKKKKKKKGKLKVRVRVYKSPMLGTGTKLDPYRSVFHSFVNVGAGEWFDEMDHPGKACFISCVHAEKSTHDAIEADGKAKPLSPLYDSRVHFSVLLDTLISDLQTAFVQSAKDTLEEAGVDTSWVVGSDTLRVVLKHALRTFAFAQMVHPQAVRGGRLLDLFKIAMNKTIGELDSDLRQHCRDWMVERELDVSWITNATTVREVLKYVAKNLNIPRGLFVSGEKF